MVRISLKKLKIFSDEISVYLEFDKYTISIDFTYMMSFMVGSTIIINSMPVHISKKIWGDVYENLH